MGYFSIPICIAAATITFMIAFGMIILLACCGVKSRPSRGKIFIPTRWDQYEPSIDRLRPAYGEFTEVVIRASREIARGQNERTMRGSELTRQSTVELQRRRRRMSKPGSDVKNKRASLAISTYAPSGDSTLINSADDVSAAHVDVRSAKSDASGRHEAIRESFYSTESPTWSRTSLEVELSTDSLPAQLHGYEEPVRNPFVVRDVNTNSRDFRVPDD